MSLRANIKPPLSNREGTKNKNDENFIEELRQKREEYGVTQTRLAVACGISREYYNRIEKGKQPLNDELKEIIETQIGRFKL